MIEVVLRIKYHNDLCMVELIEEYQRDDRLNRIEFGASGASIHSIGCTQRRKVEEKKKEKEGKSRVREQFLHGIDI